MEREKKILYIINLDNTQDQYAFCAEIIRILEDEHHSNAEESFERLKDMLDKVRVSGCPLNYRGSKVYFEQPLNHGELGLVQKARPVLKERVQRDILYRSSNVFHIRIHLDRAADHSIKNLSNLQFLVLMLKGLQKRFEDDSELQNKFSVFVVPHTGEYYPFCNENGFIDEDTYEVVSQYLRLFAHANSGIIYGAKKDIDRIVVRAINFKKVARIQESFPLIPLTIRGYKALFENCVNEETIHALSKLRRNGRYGKANAENPEDAICDFAIESAYRRIRDVVLNTYCEEALEYLMQSLIMCCGAEGIPVMAFVILGFTFFAQKDKPLYQSEIMSQVTQLHDFAVDLCAGINQLAQNSLQYSESRESELALSLHNEHDDPAHSYVELSLTDYNSQLGWVGTFIANLNEEIHNTESENIKNAYQDLVMQKQEIALGDFFGEYGAQSPKHKQAWTDFRKADTAAHIGMAVFSISIQKYNGSILAANSITGNVDENSRYRHQGVFADGSQIPILSCPDRILPGTQITVRLPLARSSQYYTGMGQLRSTMLEENYEVFSGYLEWDVKTIAVTCPDKLTSIQNQSVLDAAVKRQCVAAWEMAWRDAFHAAYEGLDISNLIYQYDLGWMSNSNEYTPDYCELLLKGFINALSEFTGEGPYCIALCSAPKMFMQVLRGLCVSLAAKSFPKGLQIYIYCKDNVSENILLCGDTFYSAVNTAYQLSFEHGTSSFDEKERKLCSQLYRVLLGKQDVDGGRRTKTKVCPFDTMLSVSGINSQSVFVKRIEQLAEHPLDEYPYGYKLSNTHMRLGNKVHIQSFYEMSFLFYRTAVSNRLAFEILKDLRNRDDIDLLNDPLLFYGYASYSKALLTALLEIVTAYRRRMKGNNDCPLPLAIASYQYNLRSEYRTKETQVYFDFANSSLGENISQNRVEIRQPSLKVIQIVPISSTLTTFGKMQSELERSLYEQRNLKITWVNYTIFWVVDEQAEAKSDTHGERKLIRDYYTVTSSSERLVTSIGAREDRSTLIKYFMKATTRWHNPLACELCYPDNPVCEVPLVETDQTSTVPAQQIRARKLNWGCVDHTDNDERIIALEKCVLYGHIKRDHNHFTYYLDTQKYFNDVGGKLKGWLEKARVEADDEQSNTIELNIIFSPEHSTNVGFAQYVNNYYFGGSAEVVCINKNKQYRSNFECEHMSLINTIQELLKDAESSESKDLPVRFYFADDTIVSGDSFFKANSFLHSLIPPRYKSKYPPNLFSKCFLLVDRLSNESKRAYVSNPEKNFISFVHIDISSMRVQGDSSVGCKAYQNAEHLLKRSATENAERHWRKQLKDLAVKNFDQDKEILEIESQKNAFRRLVLSHVAQNAIFRENDSFSVGSVYDTLLILLAKILDCQLPSSVSIPANCSYSRLLTETRIDDPIQDVKLFIDTVSRPFFAFDFKVRVPVETLLLLWAENLFGTPVVAEQLKIDKKFHKYHEHKGFLLENGRLETTNLLVDKIRERLGNELLNFIQGSIMQALVELRSTYLIRKSTFQHVYKLLDAYDEEKVSEFLDQYAVQIQQLSDGTTDEIKSLWLEYILISGKEYDPVHPAECSKTGWNLEDPLVWYDNRYGVDSANSKKNHASADDQRKEMFRKFGREVFLQNSRILFDGMKELSQNDEFGDYHFMDCWNQFRKLDCNALHLEYTTWEDARYSEKYLFETIKSVLNEYNENRIYNRLIEAIKDMASKKYCIKCVDVACLTSDENEKSRGMQQIDIVFRTFDDSTKLYRIKKCFLDSQDGSLKKSGYVLGNDVDNCIKTEYFLVRFGHQADESLPDGMRPQPVYLYIGFDSAGIDNSTLRLLLLLRDILSYRHWLQRIFDKHFSGRALSKYVHTAAQREIVANEKAVSHNTTSGDRVALEVLQNQNKVGDYKLLDSSQVSKWLLLRNYTDSQIAKLFNRTCIHDNETIVPSLYLKQDSKPKPWKERALCGFYDLCLAQDNRFGLLSTAVSFNYQSDLRNAQFIQDEQGRYYNAEYFRCLLIDIIFTAMKYKSNGEDFLQYIDRYLEIEQDIKNHALLPEIIQEDRNDQRCVIELERSINQDASFDYLVIRNKVSCEAHGIFDLDLSNIRIVQKLRDPLDYPDGHLSLLTISRYIENFREDLKEACRFEYKKPKGDNEDADKNIFFESWLPVLKKGDEHEHK